MPTCNVCGANYSHLKKECPECPKAVAVIPPSQMQLTNVDPVSLRVHQVQAGHFIPISTNVNLHKDEIALFTTQATLAEDKTTSSRVGGSSGISVPVGYGIRLHTGSLYFCVTAQSY